MYVKVCGITRFEDALAAIAAGADALGFNAVPSSKRYLDPVGTRAIVARLRREAPPGIVTVAVVADLTPSGAAELMRELGVDRLQLHGDEAGSDVVALAPHAFKALRVADAADVAHALAFAGHPLLVDAKVQGQLGGTGQAIDWPLVEPLARARPLILAGGLTPENVARAVSVVRPWAVDVASGVEFDHDARRKDPDRLRRFVEQARRDARTEHTAQF